MKKAKTHREAIANKLYFFDQLGDFFSESSEMILNHKGVLYTILMIAMIVSLVLGYITFFADFSLFLKDVCMYVGLFGFIVAFLGAAVNSVMFSFLLFAFCFLVAALLQGVSLFFYDLPYQSYYCALLTLFFVVVWGICSLIIHSDVAQLVNHSMTTLTTITTLVGNVIILSKQIRSEISVMFNYIVAPFIIVCAISSVLIDLKVYCIKKYIKNDQANTAD